MINKNLAGVVLSGGKSSRMGKDKGLVLYKKKPMALYSIELLHMFTDDIVISTSDTSYHQFGLPLIPDIYPNIGPIGGIHSVLKSIKEDKCIVIACDMPNASEHILNRLLKHSNNYDIIIPIREGKMEPLLGIYSTTIIKQIEIQIKKKDYKLINLLKMCNTKYVSFENDNKVNTESFKNINYPEDAK